MSRERRDWPCRVLIIIEVKALPLEISSGLFHARARTLGRCFSADFWKSLQSRMEIHCWQERFLLTRHIDPFVPRGYIEQIGLHYTLAHVPPNLSTSLTFLLLFWDNCFSSLIALDFSLILPLFLKKFFFFHQSVYSEILSESCSAQGLCCGFRAFTVGQQPRRLLLDSKQSGSP